MSVETILPGGGFVSETASAQTLWSGYGFVSETQSGNAPTNITCAQAAWAWTGQVASVNAQTAVALAQATWTWAGRPLASAVATFQNLMLFFGIGP
jgi:hypothetical protein